MGNLVTIELSSQRCAPALSAPPTTAELPSGTAPVASPPAASEPRAGTTSQRRFFILVCS